MIAYLCCRQRHCSARWLTFAISDRRADVVDTLVMPRLARVDTSSMGHIRGLPMAHTRTHSYQSDLREEPEAVWGKFHTTLFPIPLGSGVAL
jgi:hypothetical protein